MWTLELQKILEEVKRQNTRRKRDLGEHHILATGTRIAHNLGIVPNEFSITPLAKRGSAPMSWCHYRPPDSEFIYIKANISGYFLVCVAGG